MDELTVTAPSINVVTEMRRSYPKQKIEYTAVVFQWRNSIATAIRTVRVKPPYCRDPTTNSQIPGS